VYQEAGYIKKLLHCTGHGKMPVSGVTMIKKRLQKKREIPMNNKENNNHHTEKVKSY
jgi:hypothetical protein